MSAKRSVMLRWSFLWLIGSLAALSGCGIPWWPSGPTSGPNLPARPSGSTFEDAAPVEFDAEGNAAFSGTVSGSGPDVFDLGACQIGDRIVVSVDPAPGSVLDPTAAVFNAAGELLALNDDYNLDGGQIGSRIDEVVSIAEDHYYLAIAKFYFDTSGGEYTVTVRIERGGTFERPPVQYLLLDFDGGTVTLPGEGTLDLTPFDAADIDATYAGQTAAIKAKIVETVAQSYRNTGLQVLTTDDPPPPPDSFSSLFFGGYSATKFGLAEDVDQGNRDRCDDGIVFTDDFDKPFAVQPTVEGVGIAIGNVAAHEAGHLLGLNHVADIADLMDNTGTASTLLADQEFKTAPLSPSVFPLGTQNGPLMLDRVVPR